MAVEAGHTLVDSPESAAPGAGDRQVLGVDLSVLSGAGDPGGGGCGLLPGRLLGMDRYFLTLRGGEEGEYERNPYNHPGG